MKKSSKNVFFVVFAVVFVICTGCSAGFFKNYGAIAPSGDVTKAIESFQIDPNLNYYISGSYVYPNALMGLDKAYTLDSGLWKKVELTPRTFREFVTNMQTKALNLGQLQHGFAILDDQGKRIGVWYSILSVNTVVRMKDSRTVIIHTPDLDTYEKFERDGRDNSK